MQGRDSDIGNHTAVHLFGGPAHGESFTVSGKVQNAIIIPAPDPLPLNACPWDVSFTEHLYLPQKACIAARHPCAQGILVYHIWLIYVHESVQIRDSIPAKWKYMLLRIPPDYARWQASYFNTYELAKRLDAGTWKLHL